MIVKNCRFARLYQTNDRFYSEHSQYSAFFEELAMYSVWSRLYTVSLSRIYFDFSTVLDSSRQAELRRSSSRWTEALVGAEAL